MSLIPWQVPAGLGLALVLSCMGNYALWQRAKAAEATAQPLRDAATGAAALAEGHRQALQTCENEKLAMRKANAEAIAAAERERDEAEARAEEYQKLLANPPAGCVETLAAQLCPAVMDY